MTAKELCIDTQYEFETQARTKANQKIIADITKKMEDARRKPSFQLDYNSTISEVIKYYFERRGYTVLISDSTTTFTWDNPKEN